MIWLTAWLTLLVSALGSTLVLRLPVIILATLWPAFTFSFFHWVWAKLNRMVWFKKEKGVEVFEMLSGEDYSSFARRRRFYEEELDADKYAEKHWIVEKVSSKWNPYREYNWNKYFASWHWMFVITKDWLSYRTDWWSYYGDDELIPSQRKRWYQSIVAEDVRDDEY